jgi:hypothetical protein
MESNGKIDRRMFCLAATLDEEMNVYISFFHS